MPSYHKINYSLRPAKNIERKMLAETFRRLSFLAEINSYRYIGFGSIYFTDFILFHKSLGLTNMISIEENGNDRERFEFNKPYKCIQMKYGSSNAVLPQLTWKPKTIAWFDYDGVLNASVLTDINFFCSKAQIGSVIIISVNAELLDTDDGNNALEELRARVGVSKVPSDVVLRNLSGWNTAGVYRRIMSNEVSESLRIRNGARKEYEMIKFKQLFNLCYSDNAKMFTFGGLLYTSEEINQIEKASFEDLPFISTGDNPFMIEVPKLTYREIRHLEANLPNDDLNSIEKKGIPTKDVEKFARMYRYFPNFAETEL